jgi:hypothetical protein
LSPALKDGGSFGGFDYDTTLTSLGTGLYQVIHSVTNGDAVSQMISWNTLDWRAIHAGHFPLWNDYSGLGMPEFLNFESGVLSLPDLVSYAVPLRFAFLVVVFVKLLIAGTGTYAWCRALRLGSLAATFGGVTFMLAGAFSSWVTWPLTDVVAWVGWICCFAILAYRTRGRLRHVAGLAVAVAFSIYGGFPEANIMVVLVLGVVVLVLGLAGLARRARPDGKGVAGVVGGALLGGILSAPLWFPGLQVIAQSHRESEGNYVGLPLKALPLTFSQGYFGMPFLGHGAFELSNWNYYETVSYVGVVAVVLVLVAFATSIRRPIVLALGVALVCTLAATYEPATFHPFESIVDQLGQLSDVRFERMRVLTALLVAVVGAVGIDRVRVAPSGRAVRRGVFVAVGVMLAVLVATAAGSVLGDLPRALAHQHLRSLLVPFASLAGAAVLLAVAVGVRRGGRALPPQLVRGATGGLVALQGAVLFFAGVGIASYSHAFYPATTAETHLEAIVGNGLIGLDGGNDVSSGDGVREFEHLGLYPEVNIGYKLRFFTIHDPVLPQAYFATWPDAAARPKPGGVALFVPDIDTADLARRYGVNFILVKPGLPAPAGTTFVTTLAGERLYRVPGAARFSFSGGAARVESVRGSATTGWTITTRGRAAAELVLRVTATAGWHVSIDGVSAPLRTVEGVLQAVRVPAGTHVVRFSYLPSRLVVATALAGAAGGVFLVVWVVIGARERNRKRKDISFADVIPSAPNS